MHHYSLIVYSNPGGYNLFNSKIEIVKFSKKTYYGLKFLLALTTGNDEVFFGIQQVSIGEDIPMKFLEAIAVILKKAGMVEVKRGAGGGYRLSKPPREILLIDVVKALEDGYGKPLKESPNSHNEKAVITILDKVLADFEIVMGKYNLADMKKVFDDLNDNLMYYI